MPQEEQRFAEIFLHDVQCANITLEPDKTFREYITEYMTSEKDRQVDALAAVFGLDKQLLKQMLLLDINEQNINEFNRFTRLKDSVDKIKAKAWLEAKSGQPINLFKVNIEVSNILKKFIIDGRFDIETESENHIMLPYQDVEHELPIAAEDIFIYGSIPVDLPNTDRSSLVNDQLSLILMYAIAPKARPKTESAGKIALGIKEYVIKEEQFASYRSVKYLLFHYWSNPQVYKLTAAPVLVDNDAVPSDYLKRMPEDAVKFLLLEYNPQEPLSFEHINILKTQRRQKIRYMPFVTTLESIRDNE